MPRKFKFHENLTKITGSLHSDRHTLVIISSPVLVRMRNVSEKICTENQNTHVGKYCRAGQDTDDNMAHARCVLDA